MNKLKLTALLISTALLLSACKHRPVGEDDTVSEATIAVVAEAVEESECECEVCVGDGRIYVEHPLGAYNGSIMCNVATCFELELTERAVQLIVDLDNDYDNAVEQIRFEPSPRRDFKGWRTRHELSYLEWQFGGCGDDLLWIEQVSAGSIREEHPFASFALRVYFCEEYKLHNIYVEFVNINGEWWINNLYKAGHGS